MRGVVLVPGDKQDLLWLNNNFSIDHASWKDLLLDPGGTRDLPGGSFTSSPAGVSLAPGRLDIFGLGLDYSVYHKTYDATAALGLRWSANWEDLGGNLTSPPVVHSPSANQIDPFGLGPDQGLLHRRWNGSAGATGKNSGAASPALRLSCRRRPERMIFSHAARTFLSITPIGRPHPRQCGLRWVVACLENQGRPQLLQSFVFTQARSYSWPPATAPSGIPFQTVWFGRLGILGPAYKAGSGKAAIRFISELVVAAFFPNSDVTFGIPPGVGGISTGVALHPAGTGSGPPPPATVISGHVRVDVFAVGEDNALWHKWLTDGAWHGELNGDLETGNWSQVPGASLACAPSLLSFNRGETVISMPPVAIQMAVAYTDGTIHLWSFDGTIFSDLYNGPNLNFRLPCTYSFSLDTVEIDNTKSRLKDTDLAVGALAVATWPVRTASFSMGRVDNGTYHYSDRVLIGPITVELCEPLIFTYSIVNKSDLDTSVNVAKAVIATVQKGTEDYVNDLVKDGKITFSGSLEGATFAALLDLAVSEIEANLFENCDGVVVADSKNFFRGRAIQELVATAGVAGKFTSTAQYVGTEDPGDCEISNYKVSVSISQH